VNPTIAFCSWSLRPADAAEVVHAAQEIGVANVQLALDPLRRGDWDRRETQRTLCEAGIAICSGMMTMAGEDYTTLETIRTTGGVRPDEHWQTNLAAARENADLARELGVDLVTFHAGFIPESRDDPERAKLITRLRTIADIFAQQSVRVALETGQETADTLLDALDELDRPAFGVNFDPANMILYDRGDPVAALRKLAPRVVQIHIKDAVRTEIQGTWGRDVPVGSGDVDWPAFFAVLHDAEVSCDLVIEREAGQGRIPDMRAACELIERFLA